MAQHRHLDVLSGHVGFLGRRRVDKIVSKEAEYSLKKIAVARNQALERIATDDITATELAVTGSIRANLQRLASTLAEDAAAETGASQLRLSTLGAAERLSHVINRSDSYAAVRSRRQSNELSEAEAEALNSRSDADLAADVERTDLRVAKTKAFVDEVFDSTVESLKRSFDFEH
ncbi:MAG: hypothetical protein ABSH08_17830 [Tepidisphaeraceae bacterium]